MENLLTRLVEENRKYLHQGQVATYIPELGTANPKDLAICMMDSNGNIVKSGDYKKKFTIQSVSKPLMLAMAISENGEEDIFKRVGKEPSGDPFNSFMKLEIVKPSKPYNPFINAGAIAVASTINGDSIEDKVNKLLHFVRKLAGNDTIDINYRVFTSERITGDRNRALAYILKNEGIIEGNAEETLDLYFSQCSIEMTVEDLARIGLCFANGGVDPITGERHLEERIVKLVNTMMFTCGMYDESGEFAVNVGIPAKSGVGGGIMAVVPKNYGIGVFGPALDKKGNSIGGVHLLEAVSNELKLGII